MFKKSNRIYLKRSKWYQVRYRVCLQRYQIFLFSDPNAKKNFKSDSLWKLITKMTHFHFLGFFFVVFLIPTVSNGGNEPPSWHVSARDRLRLMWPFFFNFFCSFPPFQLAGLIFLFLFFLFFCQQTFPKKIIV